MCQSSWPDHGQPAGTISSVKLTGRRFVAETDEAEDEEEETAEVAAEAQKRKSDAVDGEETAEKEVTPAKKSKTEEKEKVAENGDAAAEATA